MQKKISAGAVTADSRHALFADKWGDVAAAELANPASDAQMLLGHLCAIITAVAVSPDNKCVCARVCVCKGL
jgi:hypothetical protein